MNKTFAKKFNMEIKIALIIAAAAFLLLAGTLFLSLRLLGLNQQADLSEVRIRQYRKTMGDEIDRLIEAKESQRAALEQTYLELESRLSRAYLKDAAGASPLFFKKKLFEAQEDIAFKAKRNNVLMPQDLGFEAYLVKLPEASMSVVLTGELFFMQDMAELLLESKIDTVNSIQLAHKVVLLDNKAQTDLSFKSFSAQLNIEADFKNLKGFLLGLAGIDKTFVVGRINIRKTDESNSRLVAEINIQSIEL